MKYKIITTITFFIFVFTLSSIFVKANNLSLIGKIIYLDSGHGGVDSGATINNYKEKDINLILTKKLANNLSLKGATVLLTREDDNDLASSNASSRKRSDLANRAKKINESKANLYISIHLNATANSKWRGLQIFYTNKNKKNRQLADYLNESIKKNIQNVRNIKEENNYYMYRQITIPGVLIEAGFLSNPSDSYLLRDEKYQDMLTNTIANAIEGYLLS